MPYSQLTFAQLKAQLAERQEDTGNIYYTDAENGLYLIEALRTWQALTHCWRDRMTFQAIQNLAWYDLTKQAGTLIPFTETDSDLISIMLYQLVEPQLAGPDNLFYAGTDMFTLGDFTGAIQRRRDQFLLETGMIAERSVINLPAPPISRVPLVDTIIDVLRVAFIGGVTLPPNDQYARMTIGKLDDAGIATLMVRSDSKMFWGTGYILYCFNGGQEAGDPVQLFKIINNSSGNQTIPLATSSQVISLGDVIVLSAQGSTISVWRNGSLLLSVTDSSIATGSPGLILYGDSAQTDATVTQFDCGSVSGETSNPSFNQLGSDVFTADSPGPFDPDKWRQSTWPTDYPLVIAELDSVNQAAPSPQSIGKQGIGYASELFNLSFPFGVYTTLWKTDEWRASAFKALWEVSPQNPPSNFSLAGVPPITLKIVPPGSGSGAAELITVSSGIAVEAGNNLLGIPDDFVWVLKWGALADLLGREGQSKDVKRAQYCEARWQEGIAIARITSSVVNAYINEVATFPTSVHALSTYRPSWQNDTGKPDTVASMCWNLIALSKVPDGNGPYSVSLEVMQNAPVPVNGSDLVQVSQEELDVILDYAQHVASFKQGGKEFMDTLPLYQNFIRLATVRNERLKAAIPFYDTLSDRSKEQDKQSPRRTDTGG